MMVDGAHDIAHDADAALAFDRWNRSKSIESIGKGRSMG